VKLRLKDGTEIECQPGELPIVVRELRAAGLLNDAPFQTSFARDQPITLQIASEPPAPSRPTNEGMLYEYARDVGLSKKTRTTYANSVVEFERTIAPKSFIDVTRSDVQRWVTDHLEHNCRHLEHVGGQGRNRPGLLRFHCGKGVFPWTPAKPPSCAKSCPLFAPQKHGPVARLKALKHFMDFLIDRGLRTDNPVELVKRKTMKARGPVRQFGNKYGPPLDEAREIIRAVIITGTPRDVGVVLALAKWGRRPSHTLLVRERDLAHVERSGAAWADFSWVKEEMERRNGNARTKLNGNLYSPIDAEFRMWLHYTYLPYRRQKWKWLTRDDALFPGDRSGEAYREDYIQHGILDPALEWLRDHAKTPAEREKWARRLDVDDATHITPGSWRHVFTMQQKLAGVENDDIDVLRGDTIRASRGAYMDWQPEQVCALNRMPALLSA